MSTLKLITNGMSRFGIGSNIQCISSQMKLLDSRKNQSNVNTEVQTREIRMHFKGFKRNWPEFHYYMFEKRHHVPEAWKIPRTRSYRFPGHVDVYGKTDGKRQPLDAALLRFKRLDFGAYVNAAIGRANRAHQKTKAWRMMKEQHYFTFYDFHQKLDRMFLSHHKEKRYIIDDPYEKYNKMSFVKHKTALEKNEKLIEERGNKIHHYDRYRFHQGLPNDYNYKVPREIPMPPGFLKTIKDNNGEFKPENENYYHEPEWMAPHFERTPIKKPEFVMDQKNFKKSHFRLDKDMENMRKGELFYKRLRPWSRVMHKTRY